MKPTPLFLTVLMIIFFLGLHALFFSVDEQDMRLPMYKLEKLYSTTPKFPDKNKFSRFLEVNKGMPYLIPSDNVLRGMSEAELFRIYWRYITTIQILCRNQSRFGSLFNGGKEVCLDNNYKPERPCIVYSFGSNFQFDFDVAVRQSLGCFVYTYDPTMNIEGKVLPGEIKFFSTGLAGRDYISDEKWEMKTLKTIMKDNGHDGKTIDIIKMDIEGSEWESLNHMIKSGVYKHVKQLLVEVHVGYMIGDRRLPYWGGMDIVKQLGTLRLLYENGFRIFMREFNRLTILNIDDGPQLEKFTPITELSLINIAFPSEKI